jgi:hypothetical protein
MERNHPRLEPTRDHFVPESRGGTEIIIACYQCNMTKADMLPEQWIAFMERVPGWWKLSKLELRAVRRQAGPLFDTPGQQARDYSKRINQARGFTQRGNPKKPVIVPPGLIWKRGNLIEATKAEDALLRAVGTVFPSPASPACAVSPAEAPIDAQPSISAPAPHSGDLL